MIATVVVLSGCSSSDNTTNPPETVVLPATETQAEPPVAPIAAEPITPESSSDDTSRPSTGEGGSEAIAPIPGPSQDENDQDTSDTQGPDTVEPEPTPQNLPDVDLPEDLPDVAPTPAEPPSTADELPLVEPDQPEPSQPPVDYPDEQVPEEETPDEQAPEEQTPDEPIPLEPVLELSPVELLFNEIRFTAGLAILQTQQKLRSGEDLTDDEHTCLGSFDPALGENLTSLECERAIVIRDTVLQVSTVVLNPLNDCQQSIADGGVEHCQLEVAAMKFPIQWVTADQWAPVNDLAPFADNTVDLESRIANIHPIAGLAVNYNDTDPGHLHLSSTSNVTGFFDCKINIQTASLVTAESRGNCQSEISAAINRMFAFRNSLSN